MYKLFIANKTNSSWSLRPWILLQQLAIPFEEVQLYFQPDKKQQKLDFLQASPSAKVPALHHNAEIIWDSLAIAEYIAEEYPQVWANERNARAWSRCACAEMHSSFVALRSQCSMNTQKFVRLDQIDSALAADLARINQLWTEGLTRFGGEFLAGSRFTAVDAFFAPVVIRLIHYGLMDYLSPAANAYAKRIYQLPSMQKWLTQAELEHDRPIRNP
ncbi:glutathione S-transferase family protein [Testudinibacter sp. TR-2022]|uniref:glutathione S-transferase family protein n=1 Tax=Testudinibacter sp. TR-2022 TaxID=2585029 RepID=UPI00111BA0A8|nr:glutathione S-transferase family protein [Testudinibacter sp. TR-2022]TNH08940.1 glutathione S-transferase family protein [Pasteurellaceae bacterium Phil11]TNH23454.1 glutathione S-transferase family protein [Testudinibacter sp. TR-2022]TNH28742.1 glutathione S-transferase family protein [Testudinibacter sp. TR-2022]